MSTETPKRSNTGEYRLYRTPSHRVNVEDENVNQPQINAQSPISGIDENYTVSTPRRNVEEPRVTATARVQLGNTLYEIAFTPIISEGGRRDKKMRKTRKGRRRN
jgi:hypothetical protein